MGCLVPLDTFAFILCFKWPATMNEVLQKEPIGGNRSSVGNDYLSTDSGGVLSTQYYYVYTMYNEKRESIKGF